MSSGHREMDIGKTTAPSYRGRLSDCPFDHELEGLIYNREKPKIWKEVIRTFPKFEASTRKIFTNMAYRKPLSRQGVLIMYCPIWQSYILGSGLQMKRWCHNRTVHNQHTLRVDTLRVKRVYIPACCRKQMATEPNRQIATLGYYISSSHSVSWMNLWKHSVISVSQDSWLSQMRSYNNEWCSLENIIEPNHLIMICYFHLFWKYASIDK